MKGFQKAAKLWLSEHRHEVTMLELPDSVEAIERALLFAFESGYLRGAIETLEEQKL